MGLVWQCARCGETDPGQESQREGHQPPDNWLRMYVPTHGPEGEIRQHSDVICFKCREVLLKWFESEH